MIYESIQSSEEWALNEACLIYPDLSEIVYVPHSRVCILNSFGVWAGIFGDSFANIIAADALATCVAGHHQLSYEAEWRKHESVN